MDEVVGDVVDDDSAVVDDLPAVVESLIGEDGPIV